MRSSVLPARDLWYSEGTINYYYGGQYFAVFLSKLSGCKVEITYNLMRTFVAGLAFVMPFSLVYQMASDRVKHSLTGRKAWIPVVSGITAGFAVSIAGNMHYVIYSKIFRGSRSGRERKFRDTGFPTQPAISGIIRTFRTRQSMNFPAIPLCLGIFMPML